jgi:colanic acid/amylovoran biosynthesis protein
MKNILFVNAYSARNLGDYAIILGMEEVIRQAHPDCNIFVSSSHHKANKVIYGKSLNSIDAIWNISKGNFIKKYIAGIMALLHVVFFPNASKYDKYRDADIICPVGGGYLYSSPKGFLGVGLLNMLFHIWIGCRFGKRVVCFPQSVGPIRYSIDSWIIKKVLSKVDTFFSRENMTTMYLTKELGLMNVVESIDIAFALQPGKPYAYEFNNPNFDKMIGITVLDWRFSKRGSSKKDISKYLQKIANTLNDIAKQYRINVLIFPQVTVAEKNSDLPASYELKSYLNNINVEIFKLPSKLEPKRLMATYGGADIFIGSRMHSTIFSLKAGCTTIGLAYQPKTTGTFAQFGLINNAVDIEYFSEEELKRLILKGFSDNKINLESSIEKHISKVKNSLLDL